ncbi:hypothetical protein M5K25_027130 [Dendrobium thyrsiflorum]|uniref:Uncharacterized protein n=1 Tax=Dendrobium thyrsiflorum TaxID=117978 RepID=A0ABD0TZ86_DENTH
MTRLPATLHRIASSLCTTPHTYATLQLALTRFRFACASMSVTQCTFTAACAQHFRLPLCQQAPHRTAPLLLSCIGDPEVDAGFVFDEQGRTNILGFPFFDVFFGFDETADDYIDRILYQLSLSLKEHIRPGHWVINRRPPPPPPPAPSPADTILRATCLTLFSLFSMIHRRKTIHTKHEINTKKRKPRFFVNGKVADSGGGGRRVTINHWRGQMCSSIDNVNRYKILSRHLGMDKRLGKSGWPAGGSRPAGSRREEGWQNRAVGGWVFRQGRELGAAVRRLGAGMEGRWWLWGGELGGGQGKMEKIQQAHLVILPSWRPPRAIQELPASHSCCPACIVDPELDHGFVYNDQGQVDILISPFFDVNLEIDRAVEEYVESITFSLAASIDEQLSPVQWQIIHTALTLTLTLTPPKSEPKLSLASYLGRPPSPSLLLLGFLGETSFSQKESSRTAKSVIHSTSTSRVLCMADPERDSDFIYNEQGFVDILRSPFFDVNPEVDNSAEEYLESIIFTLSNSIEEQLSTIQWQITAKPRQGETDPDKALRPHPGSRELSRIGAPSRDHARSRCATARPRPLRAPAAPTRARCATSPAARRHPLRACARPLRAPAPAVRPHPLRAPAARALPALAPAVRAHRARSSAAPDFRERTSSEEDKELLSQTEGDNVVAVADGTLGNSDDILEGGELACLTPEGVTD